MAEAYMERGRFERLGKVTAGAIILGLGAFATEGCAQSHHPAPSPQVEASTLPIASTTGRELPVCTSDGPAPKDIAKEVEEQNVQKDVATSFNLSPGELTGESEVVTVDCKPVIDARAYQKITVLGLAGTYSNIGHCALIPVANMPIRTTKQIAECVPQTK